MDGKKDVVFTSQGAGVIGYWPIPPNPRQEPWPEPYIIYGTGTDDYGVPLTSGIECLHVIDINKDGKNDLVAGAHGKEKKKKCSSSHELVFYPQADPHGLWKKQDLDFTDPARNAIGDLNEGK